VSANYNVRQAKGVTIVDVTGRITLNETSSASGALGAFVRELVKGGRKDILLNFRDVAYLDSSGVGDLFGCFTTVKGHGGTLKVSSPSERVRDLLSLTKLNTVIEVIEDEAAAVNSFAKGAA